VTAPQSGRLGGPELRLRPEGAAGTALHTIYAQCCARPPSPCFWLGPRWRSRPPQAAGRVMPQAGTGAGVPTPIIASSARGSGAIRGGAQRGERGSARGASPAAGPTRQRSPNASSGPFKRSDRPGGGVTLTTARDASRRGRTDMPAPVRRAIAPSSPNVPAADGTRSRCPSHTLTSARALPARRPRMEPPSGARDASGRGRSPGRRLREPRGRPGRVPSARGSRSAPCRASRRRSRG
jgi:hypothetical protein